MKKLDDPVVGKFSSTRKSGVWAEVCTNGPQSTMSSSHGKTLITLNLHCGCFDVKVRKNSAGNFDLHISAIGNDEMNNLNEVLFSIGSFLKNPHRELRPMTAATFCDTGINESVEILAKSDSRFRSEFFR